MECPAEMTAEKTNGVPHCNAVREAIVKLVDHFVRRSAHDLANHEHSRELRLCSIQLSHWV